MQESRLFLRNPGSVTTRTTPSPVVFFSLTAIRLSVGGHGRWAVIFVQEK